MMNADLPCSLLLFAVVSLPCCSRHHGAPVTPVKAWQIAERIEPFAAESSRYPRVAFDRAGNAIAVWIRIDASRSAVWANRLDATAGWQTAGPIAAADPGSASDPDVAMDDEGHAIAVWRQVDATGYHVRASRYSAATGWGPSVTLDPVAVESFATPRVQFGPAGYAIVVWNQDTATPTSTIWATICWTTTGWGLPERIDAHASGWAGHAELTFDAFGRAIVVWLFHDGSIWTNDYVASRGWGTADPVVAFGPGTNAPQLAVDGAGNTFVAVSHYDGTKTSNWVVRRDGAGWGPAIPLEAFTVGSSDSARIAADAAGNAVAVWSHYDYIPAPHEPLRMRLWANTYSPTAGWGTAAPIEALDPGNSEAVRIAMNRAGDAVVVWDYYDGVGSTVWATTYGAAGWGPMRPIEMPLPAGSSDPQVAVNDAGNAVVVWSRFQDLYPHIWANTYR